MRVALLQYPIIWADKEANLRMTEERLSALQGKADVALLPEMFTTGFCVQQPQLAESVGDSMTLAFLLRCARDYDLAIAGSFMAKEAANLYNRGFFVRPSGETDFVDKRHLYASGGEAELFTRGEKRVISEYKGVRFCLQICYDLRFPVWVRNATGYDYDILLYSALWPDVRIAAWDLLLPTRSVENQCYVAGVNCVGNDGIGLHYNGHSVAYDTRLHRLVEFEDNEEGTKIADFNMQNLAYFREILPLWKDADRFKIAD